VYLRHYGLRDKPFKLAHDPAYYYPAAHQVPLNELCYSLEERQGLATLVGEPGTGKTTLLRRLLQSFGPTQRGIFMSDTSLEGQSLIKQVEVAVGVLVTSPQKGRSEPLKQVLSRARDKTVVLLIDEAQGLSPLQLEELRHLSNLEVPGRKLLEIVLAGQPALKDKLASSECAALRQRVAVRTELEPLDLQHTAAYIEHRLRVAGAFDAGLFDPEAIKAIHERSQGVPRLINIICERCLVVGYVDEARTIDSARAQDAIADLKLETEEKEKKPDPPQAVAMGNGLLMRMGSRIETIEEKLDMLIKLLARSGYVRPEHAQSTRMRQYLNALRGEPSNLPPKKAAGQD
jgi:general secretion pathway protein A